MAVYDIHGNPIQSLYDCSGDSIVTAYDINGTQIYGDIDYDTYQITNIGGSVSASNTQGIDIYGDTLAVWDGDNSIRLYNVNTLTLITTIATGESMHGNDISFSDEFYAESDRYPLLYVLSNICFRLTESGNTWATTLINKLSTPNVYGMKIADCFNGKTLITTGYSENRYTYTSTNKVIIAKWDMDDLSDIGNNTYVPTLLGTVTRDWMECIQGASYHDGYVWVASGLGGTGNNGHIYALDLTTGDIVHDIDLEDTHELEGLAWGYNNTNGWYMIVGQVSIGFRKITFSYS